MREKKQQRVEIKHIGEIVPMFLFNLPFFSSQTSRNAKNCTTLAAAAAASQSVSQWMCTTRTKTHLCRAHVSNSRKLATSSDDSFHF